MEQGQRLAVLEHSDLNALRASRQASLRRCQAELLDAVMEAAKGGAMKAEDTNDVFFLGRLALAFSENERATRELALKEQQLELKRREVEAAEKKLNAALAKEQAIHEKAEKAKRAIEAAKAKGGVLPAEVEKAVLGIYGVTEAN